MSGIYLIIEYEILDHLEEQAMEIEAMEAVFMEDFECKSYTLFYMISNIK